MKTEPVESLLYRIIIAMAQRSREDLALYVLRVEEFLYAMMPHSYNSHDPILFRYHKTLDGWLFSQWMYFHYQADTFILRTLFCEYIGRGHRVGK